MSEIDSQNLQAIRDMLEQLFSVRGFYAGFSLGLTFGAGFLIAHFLRNVWSDRED